MKSVCVFLLEASQVEIFPGRPTESQALLVARFWVVAVHSSDVDRSENDSLATSFQRIKPAVGILVASEVEEHVAH